MDNPVDYSSSILLHMRKAFTSQIQIAPLIHLLPILPFSLTPSEPLLYKGSSLLSECILQSCFSKKLRFPFTYTLLSYTLFPYYIRGNADFDINLPHILSCASCSLAIAFLIHYLNASLCRIPLKYKASCHFCSLLYFTSPIYLYFIFL